jgi:flavin-dependent dehydrogenase
MSDGHTEENVDVLILGGGIAGLSLAYQLKRTDPEIDIMVVEKRKHPLVEAAHKVGESTLPVSARYFEQVLGLEEHLKNEQLPKFGLRYFASHDGNHDISLRPEVGVRRFAPIPSYQLDRGRLENFIGERAREAGVKFLDDTRVGTVDLDEPHHRVSLSANGDERTIHAQWLVDASGRAAILKNKLGLASPVKHDANAAWFRIGRRIAIDDWSQNPEWQSRVLDGQRWLSTVHLCGQGYWVWLIPLASGSTSIGVVTDPKYVPFERLRRFEAVVEWLQENEPQVAEAVQEHVDELQDFLTLKSYPRRCTQVFSTDRWFITGDAGIFLDPLYSPGMEFISVSNSIIEYAIVASRRGDSEKVTELMPAVDQIFRTLTDLAFNNYVEQYGAFGNTDTMAAKVTWAQIEYFSVLAPVAFGSDFLSQKFLELAASALSRYGALNTAFHIFIRDWSEIASEDAGVGMVGNIDAVTDNLQTNVTTLSSEEELAELIRRNVSQLENYFWEIIERVTAVIGFDISAYQGRELSDQDLLDFSLEKLPRTEPGESLPLPKSKCGLIWATKDQPGSATSDAWSAWPSLQNNGLLPPPVTDISFTKVGIESPGCLPNKA